MDEEKLNEKENSINYEEIIQLLNDKQYVKARTLLLQNNPVDISEILEEIIEEEGIDKAILAFRMLPKAISVEVFSYLPPSDQVEIISGITDRETKYIMDELDFDDMIDVLDELPANVVDKILEKSSKEERSRINTFLNYPENCAGSLMTPDYISLHKDMTVGQAMAYIKREGMSTETVYTCYVKDEGRTLIGIVSLRSLVVEEDDVIIEKLMHTDYISVNVFDDQEDVSEAFKKYGFLAMPVVDKEQRLVGIITVDDILDVIEEETTEDFQKMAGVASSNEEYLDMSVWQHFKSRIPWLFVLMCSYIITGGIISSFEALLSNVISLVAYLPMLMGTGGNSGSQSATLVIRGMALGDVELRDAGKVFWKEIRVSFLIGLTLSFLNFIRIYFFDKEGALVALTVCASMLAIVMAAKTIGSMLPMIAKKIGIDPALMASPMIASLTDMVSVVTYFALASLFLDII